MVARYSSIPAAFSSALQGSVHRVACPLRSFPPSLSLSLSSPGPCGVCRCVPAHTEVTERYQVSCSITLYRFLGQVLELTKFFG